MSVDWYAQALCARNWNNDYDAVAPDWFADRSNGKSSKAAITICRHCPVARECLQLALKCEVKTSDREGIYGGLTPDDREALWPSHEPIVRRQSPWTRRFDPERDGMWLARYNAGETCRQIAQQVGSSAGTVNKAINRERVRLAAEAS